ncbi:MAG TPA: hypothetical protein VLL50_00245 [Usitatibacter sp.]|nr:hypothetical protein [Usitatibacter sp.]
MSLAGKPVSAYRPRAREVTWRPLYGRIEKPPLWQFVVLSILLHALAIFLFGAPTGGSIGGRAMWGTLDVVLLGASPPAAPLLKLDRTPMAPAPAPLPAEPRLRPFRPIPVPVPPAPPPADVERVVVPPLLDSLPALDRSLHSFTVPPPTEVQAPAPLPSEVKPPAPAPLTPPQLIAPPPQPVQHAPVEAPIATPPPLQTLAPPRLREPNALPQLELPRVETPAIRESVEVPQMQIPRIETPTLPSLPATPNVLIPVPEPSRSTIAPVAAPPEIMAPAVPQAPAVTAPPVPAQPVEAAPAAPTQVPTVTPRVETQRVEPGPAAAPREAPRETPREAPALRPSPTPAPAPAPSETPGTDSVFRRGPPPAEAPPGYDPFSAPKTKELDLDAVKSRAGTLARKGTGNTALFAFPMPPVPPKKSKLEEALDKAHKPDCRTAYASMGLAAVVPLVANEFGEGTCKW